MMSGLVTPKSIGLTDEQHIRKLIRRTGKLLKFLRLNDSLLPTMGIIFTIVLYLLRTTPSEALFYGIPNAIILGFWTLYVTNIFLTQIIYFYIICLYLNIKINSLNERLIQMKKRKQFLRIGEILQSFDSLYNEINEYNTTFWSKFLFAFWLTIGSCDVLLLYIIIFVPFSMSIKYVFIYGSVFFITCFLFVIFTASSVNYSVNNSYKSLNSLFISYSQNNKHFYYYKITTKLKVFLKHVHFNLEYFISNYSRSVHLWREWLRRGSGSRVGSYSQLITSDVMKSVINQFI